MKEPWKTDKWFVSSWNYQKEVTNNFNFAPKIKLHDVSLRDGEQQAGLIFNADEKIRIAEKLAEVGVHRIEAGMPAVSKEDEKAVREIIKRNLGPEIFVFGRCMVDDVKLAADCGAKGIVVEIPSSEHIIKNAYGWSMEKAVDLSIKATAAAKEYGLYTVFFPIDASRADVNWCLELYQRVATEGHMDALVVVDTFGGCSPHAVPFIIKKVKETLKKPVEVHFHDDFGMGAANTVMALAAGADVAHTTITGIGERAGNAAYEDVALALLTMYGVDLGMNYEKIYETSKLLREISGIKVPDNRGIVGDMLFKIESGIIAGWYRNCIEKYPLELYPYKWDLVGQNPPEVLVGKSSGIDTVKILQQKYSLQFGEDEAKEIVLKIKEKALEKHALLDDEEVEEILKGGK